jgi:hypothetical protein
LGKGNVMKDPVKASNQKKKSKAAAIEIFKRSTLK